jgi:hypothetical protein
VQVGVQYVGDRPVMLTSNVEVLVEVERRVDDHAVGTSADHVGETALAPSAQLYHRRPGELAGDRVEGRGPRIHAAFEDLARDPVFRQHLRPELRARPLGADDDQMGVAWHLRHSGLE